MAHQQRHTAATSLHSSWRVTVAFIGYMIGVGTLAGAHQLSQLLHLLQPVLMPGGNYLWGAMLWGLLAVCGIVMLRPWKLVWIVVLCGLLCGLSHGSFVYQQRQWITLYRGNMLHVRGVVIEDPSRPDAANQTITVHKLELLDNQRAGGQGRPVSGDIWVQIDGGAEVKRGDTIELAGKAYSGFGTMVASLRRPKVLAISHQRHGDIMAELRDDFAAKLGRVVEQPAAALGLGFLTGMKQALPRDVSQALQIVGLTHIVVASGYNLTILVRFMRALVGRYSRFAGAAFGFILMMLFIMLAGASPSMLRAGLVTGLSLLLWYVGRSIHPVVLLVVTAGITILCNPVYLWGDASWLLSMTAFAGVMLWAPAFQAAIQRLLRLRKEPNAVLRIIIETGSAQLLTLPISLYIFGAVSLVALPVNILVLPLVPLAMALVFTAGLAGYVWAGLSLLVGRFAQILLDYMLLVAHFFSQLPQAQLATPAVPLWFVGVLYSGLIAILLLCQRMAGTSGAHANLVV